ncbi:MAG: InlB B-repeat-containing protein, partial [Bacillota bacterium]
MFFFLASKGKKIRQCFAALLSIALILSVCTFGNQTALAAGGSSSDNGSDLVNLKPSAEVAFAVGGDDITKGYGFEKSVYYITKDELKTIKQNKSTEGFPALANCWQSNVQYSSHDNHDTAGNYHYSCVNGLNLAQMATNLGIGSLTSIYAESTDGYQTYLDPSIPRYAYQPGASTSTVSVSPVLALAESSNTVTGSAEGKYPDSASEECTPTLMYGQTSATEDTNCKFVHDVCRVAFNTESAALTVNDGNKHTMTLSDIVKLGIYKTDYTFISHGDNYTHYLVGAPLAKVLEAMGIKYEDGSVLKVKAADGYNTEIDGVDVAKCFVAWDYENGTTVNESKQINDLALYLPGTAGNNTVFYSLSEIEVTSDQPGERLKYEYKTGDDISDSVFYIAVKDETGNVHYYYYTEDEIKAYGEETAYKYVNHSMTETTTTKGVKLKTLIDQLDISVDENWIIQYAEEDGYHADTANAVESSSYKDRVKDLTNESTKTSGEVEPARNTSIAYAINMKYDTTDDDPNNVSDPEGVFNTYKDGSLLRGYRQTSSANSSVLKYLIGVTISPDGKLLPGGSGCTINYYSSANKQLTVKAPTVIKGLVPGMKWAAKAKSITNAELAASQNAGYQPQGESFIITAGTPADVSVSFYYDEGVYFQVNNNGKVTNYVYTDLVAKGIEIPKEEDYSEYKFYGYNKPMYVRYNGCWLKDLVGEAPNGLTIKDESGKTVTVKADEIDDYFVAYNHIQSKKSTNIANYKRVTTTYEHPTVIKPATASVEFSTNISDYTPISGKTPEVLIENAVFAKTTNSNSGGGGGGAAAETFKVTFDTMGGSAVASQKVEAGEKISAPANPTRTGYTFKGW